MCEQYISVNARTYFRSRKCVNIFQNSFMQACVLIMEFYSRKVKGELAAAENRSVTCGRTQRGILFYYRARKISNLNVKFRPIFGFVFKILRSRRLIFKSCLIPNCWHALQSPSARVFNSAFVRRGCSICQPQLLIGIVG